MKTLILTFAGTWYPDKTTSSSKNLVLAVILGVSLERKTVIFRVKVSCTRQTINWVMLRSPKLHRVIHLSSWKILIIVDKGLVLSFVSRLSLWYWSGRFDRTVQVFIGDSVDSLSRTICTTVVVSVRCITNLAHDWWVSIQIIVVNHERGLWYTNH